MTTGEAIPHNNGLTRRALLAGVLGNALLLPLAAGCTESEPNYESQFSDEPDWEQDFTGQPDGRLNTTEWNIRLGNNNGWGNRQRQTYTANTRNVRVEHGALILEAHREHGPNTPTYTAARIDTQGKQSFSYGKLEVVSKLPKGTGTWPAFWMLSDDQKYDPTSYGIDDHAKGAWVFNGEIDIMEAVGSRPGIIYPALHTYDSTSRNVILQPRPQINSPDDTRAFHTYGVERTPDTISFTYDGKPYYSVNKTSLVPDGQESKAPLYWPFDQKYYLIANIAIGGTWGGEDDANYPPHGIDDSAAPWQLQVASIRHYPLND
jgi:beta-glucanase (GH16 family)